MMLSKLLRCPTTMYMPALRGQTNRVHGGLMPLLSRTRPYECQRFRSTRSDKRWKVPITWRSLGITFGVGSVILAFMLYVKREKRLAIEKERRRSLGKSSVGGRFELIDHNGEPKKSEDFHGKWLLVYFGFTHCPDICPDELEKLGKVIDILSEEAKNLPIQPLFITVDPDRDDVKAVAAYVKEFHPKILGLTGTKEQVAKASKAFRVYYSAGPRDEAQDYIVDHTVIMYLIDPDGEFIDYYGQNRTAKQISTAIQIQHAKYERAKGKSWF